MEELKIIEEKLNKFETLFINQKTVLNLEEVAAYTGLSKSCLYKKTSTGGIPCYKPNGKHIYFNKNEIDKLYRIIKKLFIQKNLHRWHSMLQT